MQIHQLRWSSNTGWEMAPSVSADLVLVFADNPFFQTEACFNELREMFPQAILFGCSTSGNVMGVEIHDLNMVATIIKLEHSRIRLASVDLSSEASSFALGTRLMAELSAPDLRHAFVLSDGLQINGSDLAKGLNQAGFTITGGLSGDGSRFQNTWVMANSPALQGRVAALGFYGQVKIKSGCFSGWDEFGAERIITKSINNIVYEIDDEPALSLYKKYLGEQAIDLPGSGLRFPLSIRSSTTDHPLIRTLLAVNEANQSLTFAGDIPQGYLCRLMRTNLDKLIQNAGLAAKAAHFVNEGSNGLCLVVSCVGRRLVMGQLTEDELEVVRDELGATTSISGFYSYGELAPFSELMTCQLHNQTLTLTTIYE
jgi:hypothetical protein